MKMDKRIWMTLLLTFVVALAGCADEEEAEEDGVAEESTATQGASPAPVTNGATTTAAHDAPASSGFALIE